MTLFIVLAIIAVGVVFGLLKAQKINGMVQEGTMSRQNISISDRDIFYIFKERSFSELYEAFCSQNIPSGYFNHGKNSEHQAIIFEGPSWKGYLIADETLPGFSCYKFSILRSTSRKGITNDADGMNVALTACEKAILSLDPHAKKGSKQATQKTTPHFI